jgi:hypothetical protein
MYPVLVLHSTPENLTGHTWVEIVRGNPRRLVPLIPDRREGKHANAVGILSLYLRKKRGAKASGAMDVEAPMRRQPRRRPRRKKPRASPSRSERPSPRVRRRGSGLWAHLRESRHDDRGRDGTDTARAVDRDGAGCAPLEAAATRSSLRALPSHALANHGRATVAGALIDRWGDARGVAHVVLHGYDRQVVNEAVTEIVAPVLDSLNFLGDIAFDWKHPAIMYLPGDAPSGRFEYLHRIHNPQPYLSGGGTRIGTLEPFSFRKLKERRVRNLSEQVMALLRKARPSPFEKRIRAALQWSGRATAERRPEMSLLFYAISLEALLLGPDRNSEQTYRLSLRVARLLGRSRAGRIALAKRARNLYAMRSKIVHAGFVGVTRKEVIDARWLSKNAISAGLRNTTLRSLVPEQRVEEWFNEHVLR